MARQKWVACPRCYRVQAKENATCVRCGTKLPEALKPLTKHQRKELAHTKWLIKGFKRGDDDPYHIKQIIVRRLRLKRRLDVGRIDQAAYNRGCKKIEAEYERKSPVPVTAKPSSQTTQQQFPPDAKMGDLPHTFCPHCCEWHEVGVFEFCAQCGNRIPKKYQGISFFEFTIELHRITTMREYTALFGDNASSRRYLAAEMQAYEKLRRNEYTPAQYGEAVARAGKEHSAELKRSSATGCSTVIVLGIGAIATFAWLWG